MTGVQTIDALLWGTKWLASHITYSSPDSTSDYEDGYESNPWSEWFTGFSRLSPTQLNAVHAILNQDQHIQLAGQRHLSVEAFTNLTIDYAEGGTGTIRLANTGLEAPTFPALAHFPENDIYGGDVWFGSKGATPVAGNEDYQTVLHELGHALGLKHAHIGTNSHDPFAKEPVLPYDTDTLEYSVMTYRSYPGDIRAGHENETWGYAQTFMMYDIRALQHLYGADFTANSGDTVYRWSPTGGEIYINGELALDPGANRIFMTVWDGNGTDTYDLSNYSTDLRIDLAPGGHSTFSTAQLAKLSTLSEYAPDYFARGNVFNALQYNGDPRSLIENAIGGRGHDMIVGNEAANALYGNAGNDILDGLGGNDSIYGGGGNDRIHGGFGDNLARGGGGDDNISGGSSNDILYGDAGNDMLDGRGGQDSIYGGGGDDVIEGDADADFESGGDGNDRFVLYNNFGFGNTVDGGAGRDILDLTNRGAPPIGSIVIDLDGIGLDGPDGTSALASIEDVWGSSASGEIIFGSSAVNRLYGNGGDDYINGAGGNDSLYGGDGNDGVLGGAGADVLIGGAGFDVLNGGAGNDRFVFDNLAASNPTAPDSLSPVDGAAAFDAPGGGAGDRIDVSGIDANATAGGDQAFQWGGFSPGAEKKAKGWLWVEEGGTDTCVLGNVDDDDEAEFKVAIVDTDVLGSAYTAADFIL
jgi:serralysin